MRWTDVRDIAIALADTYPDVDVQYINFVDLHAKVCALSDFSDDVNRSNEKILEAIQAAWLDELDE